MAWLRLAALIVVMFLPLSGRAEAQATVDPHDLADNGGYFIEVDGLETYIWEQGPEDGPVVMLLHGFLGSAFDWRENISALAEAGYRVIAFDRPPYGLSAKAADYDYSQAGQAEFTAKLMDTLDISQATLVGHSMGGNVLAHFALRYPERVNRLIIVSGAILTVGGPPPPLVDLASSPLFARPLIAALRSLAESALLEEMPPEVAERMLAPWQMPGWEDALIEVVRDSGDSMVDLEALRQIDVPVMLIWGADDPVVPVTDGQALREYFPGALWKMYPETGHLPMSENADQFNQDVLAFLGAAK